jgi:carbamoyl-phosphate synthase large subunit
MLAAEGIHVLISPPATVAMCCDKWETYRFFLANGIPTPRTSLRHAFELIKLRAGEGSTGVLRVRPEESMQIDMTGCISQEFLNGDEYSIDVLCDLRGDPIYIVPRQRCLVRSGRSVVGKVVERSSEAVPSPYSPTLKVVGLRAFRDRPWRVSSRGRQTP